MEPTYFKNIAAPGLPISLPQAFSTLQWQADAIVGGISSASPYLIVRMRAHLHGGISAFCARKALGRDSSPGSCPLTGMMPRDAKGFGAPGL